MHHGTKAAALTLLGVLCVLATSASAADIDEQVARMNNAGNAMRVLDNRAVLPDSPENDAYREAFRGQLARCGVERMDLPPIAPGLAGTPAMMCESYRLKHVLRR